MGSNWSGVPRLAGARYIRNGGVIGLMERSCARTGTPSARYGGKMLAFGFNVRCPLKPRRRRRMLAPIA